MQTYLTKTKYNTYQYQRRIPKDLAIYISSSRFRVSLGKDNIIATEKAIQFNQSIDKAQEYIKLGLPSEMILNTLLGLVSYDQKQSSTKDDTFNALVSSYQASKYKSISNEEYRDRETFYTTICPPLFKVIVGTSNPKMSDITYKHLLKFKDTISKLPKRNIQRYRLMDIVSILKIIETIEEEDTVSIRTVNKYIKWLRAVFSFSLLMGHTDNDLASKLPTTKTTVFDRQQRLPLTTNELSLLYAELPKDKKYLVKVLTYSGMRLNELYKSKIEVHDGVTVFSLLDRGIKLKTHGSYRIIPIHTSLLNDLDNFTAYREKMTSDNLSKSVSKIIKKLEFKDARKKSLYSLRHSFATKLIQGGADSNIVSELLGHSHLGMTLSRYAKGYSVKQLKEVIELL